MSEPAPAAGRRRLLAPALFLALLALAGGAFWLLRCYAEAQLRADRLVVFPLREAADGYPASRLVVADAALATELLRELRRGRPRPPCSMTREFALLFERQVAGPHGHDFLGGPQHAAETGADGCACGHAHVCPAGCAGGWLLPGAALFRFADEDRDREVSPATRRRLAELVRRWWAQAEAELPPAQADAFRRMREHSLQELAAPDGGN